MIQSIQLIRFLWGQLTLRTKLLWLSMFVLSAGLHVPFLVAIFQMQFLQLMTLRVYRNQGSHLYEGIQSLGLSKDTLMTGMYMFIILVCAGYDAIFLVIYHLAPDSIWLTSNTSLSIGTILILMGIIIGLTLFQLPSFVGNISHSQDGDATSPNRVGMIFLLIYAAGIFFFIVQLFFGGQLPLYLPLLAITIFFVVVLTDSAHRTPWDLLVSFTNSTSI